MVLLCVIERITQFVVYLAVSQVTYALLSALACGLREFILRA